MFELFGDLHLLAFLPLESLKTYCVIESDPEHSECRWKGLWIELMYHHLFAR